MTLTSPVLDVAQRKKQRNLYRHSALAVIHLPVVVHANMPAHAAAQASPEAKNLKTGRSLSPPALYQYDS